MCAEAFSTKSRLAKHFIKHSDEKPFQCPECGQKFTRKDSLNKHINMKEKRISSTPFVKKHSRGNQNSGNIFVLTPETNLSSAQSVACHSLENTF